MALPIPPHAKLFNSTGGLHEAWLRESETVERKYLVERVTVRVVALKSEKEARDLLKVAVATYVNIEEGDWRIAAGGGLYEIFFTVKEITQTDVTRTYQ